MSFHVGQKVVCVNDQQIDMHLPFARGLIKEGHIYTIRWVGRFRHPRGDEWNGVRIVGITRPGPRDAPFNISRFRPLQERKTDISFTEGAPKDSEKWDNRKKRVDA